MIKQKFIISFVFIISLISIAVLSLWWKQTFDGLVRQGREAYVKNNYAQAKVDFSKAVNMWLFSGEARGWLGLSLKREGEDVSALTELSRAISLGYRAKEVLLTRGALYYLNGRTIKAEADFRAALQQDQNYTLGNYWLAKVFLLQGKVDEARPYAEKAAQDPRLASILEEVKKRSEESLPLN